MDMIVNRKLKLCRLMGNHPRVCTMKFLKDHMQGAPEEALNLRGLLWGFQKNANTMHINMNMIAVRKLEFYRFKCL